MKQPILTTKPHYPILDGLRGVAALMVVAFHLFEAHSTSPLTQIINHGYLAVDFFFLLSGFVIGYAYDDRWGKMTVGSFFRRRLIRLQPMVIMGSIIGAICFYFQHSSLWPLIEQTQVWKLLVMMLIAFTMLPVLPSMDIRGWNESYPLNGPAWSLMYEYISNILYGALIRKFPKWLLTVFVCFAACVLVQLAITEGSVVGGWSLEPKQIHIGIARVLYPFFAGLLLFRVSKIATVKNAFLWCSLLVVSALSIPRLGGSTQPWMNGLYESVCILFIFPFIVYLGASSDVKSKQEKRICKFLGDISYPIYITHYPLIYIYTAWVADNKISLQRGVPVALLVFVSAILIAFLCLKFYDEPVRKWLNTKPIKSKNLNKRKGTDQAIRHV